MSDLGSVPAPLDITHAAGRRLPGDSAAPIAAGTRVNQYELIRELGRGGMGVVYLARDLVLGRRVAIKFLLHRDRGVVDRFLVEARATARCRHDNIVVIYEVDEWQQLPYMVLEFLEGRTLRDHLGPLGRGVAMPASRAIELILPVARGLARAHELGIVHRDLKPENILVTAAGEVKVLDFGIAKALEGRDGHRRTGAPGDSLAQARLADTDVHLRVGTLPYMSPEQATHGRVDGRSDLFALGLILWEILVGAHPVQPLSDHALHAHLASPAPLRSLREVKAGLPDALVDAVDRCLAKHPAERFASAAALASQLEELLPGRRGRALAEGESPFPGLVAFQEADANRFFGRAREVARAAARIRELPLTGVVGPSGAGKSSFIRAGVGPALKASGERWEVLSIRPGRQPLAALTSLIARALRPGGDAAGDAAHHAALQARLRREPGLLGTTLRARAAATGADTLLFVDQFEELYTLVADADERRAFCAALAAMADDAGAPLRVVIAMRSDFLDRVSEAPRFLEELSRGLVFLSPPDREGLREALEQPLQMLGYRFESEAIVSDMLDALASATSALPLIQFAAAKLWEARDRTRRVLTGASYQAIGGITGCLAAHADEVIASMDSAAQRLARRILRHLVTPERTRAVVEQADLYQLSPARDDLRRVLEHLVAARLLVVQQRVDADGGAVELAHESLIERWPTLRRWLDDSDDDKAYRAQLATAAKQWDARRRPADLLWRGELLREVQRWYLRADRELGARDQAFLDAAFALAARGARRRRLALTLTFAVLAAVAAGASAMWLRVRAARADADRNAEVARRSEAQVKAQLAEVEVARAALERANLAREAAQRAAEQTGVALETSQGALAIKNRELATALDEAEQARQRAEAATRAAESARSALAVKLDAERQRVRKLEQEQRKLSTRLKE